MSRIALMAQDELRWKVTQMIWSFFADIIVVIQVGSVVFGTVLAAPLLSSLSETRRRRGFICMTIGSLFALIATSSAGLWVLAAANAFWVVSSLRGYWLLAEQPLGAVTEGLQAATPEALQNVLDNVSDVIVETGQAVLETVNLDNRPPDAA